MKRRFIFKLGWNFFTICPLFVVQSAGKKGKTSFVPYRDSILTWLLKVLLIVTITSCYYVYHTATFQI